MLWWCFCLCSSRLARVLTLEDGWVSGCAGSDVDGMMIVWWGWWWQWWRLGGGVLFRSLRIHATVADADLLRVNES